MYAYLILLGIVYVISRNQPLTTRLSEYGFSYVNIITLQKIIDHDEFKSTFYFWKEVSKN